jgi:hypothetical protein
MHSYIIAGVVVLLPHATMAEPQLIEVENGVFTYEMFETSVPHADLSECPQTLVAEDRFCRLTLAEGNLTVWVFRNEGRQELLAMQTVDPEANAGPGP